MDEKEFYKKFEDYQLLKKEAAINKIPEWIERGNKVLPDDLHLKWKITVYSSAVSEACGIDIEEFLNFNDVLNIVITINENNEREFNISSKNERFNSLFKELNEVYSL